MVFCHDVEDEAVLMVKESYDQKRDHVVGSDPISAYHGLSDIHGLLKEFTQVAA